jgi:nucleoside-diphosphate-sugar epimerase
MENYRKRILITGAAGLIGRELCNKLSLKHHVVGVDNNFRFNDYTPENCYYVKKDLKEFIASTDNDFDYVFHMAAINGTSHFYDMPLNVLENNITTDLEIFNFAGKNKNCKLIYASSSEIVADSKNFPTAEETDVVIKDIHNSRWSYRLPKIVAENYLFNSNLDFLIVRFFNVYGANSTKGHFIGDILEKINSNLFEIHGSNETRSFCYIDDAVTALLSIYEEVSSEVINIGAQEEISILDAANQIAESMGIKDTNWKIVPSRYGSVDRRIPDITKLKSYFKEYSPISFKEGIKLVLNNRQ